MNKRVNYKTVQYQYKDCYLQKVICLGNNNLLLVFINAKI